MTTESTKTGFKTRLVNFISAFDSSPSDYIFDGIKHSSDKLRELESRVARLESESVNLSEVPQRKAG